jgi:hypothetical protein
MKIATMLGMILLSTSVSAQTVINYEDGSTYTLKNKESIYISNKDNVYTATGSMKNAVRFFNAKEWNKREYVPEPVTGDELCWAWGGVAPPSGYSYEACLVEEEQPTEEVECTPDGLTFGGGC